MTALPDQMDQSQPVWWWLSFVDNALPEGERFLGVAVVRAPSETEAVAEAGAQSCHPGGDEVAIVEIPDEFVPGARWRNRLLTEDDAETAGDPDHPDFRPSRSPSA